MTPQEIWVFSIAAATDVAAAGGSTDYDGAAIVWLGHTVSK